MQSLKTLATVSLSLMLVAPSAFAKSYGGGGGYSSSRSSGSSWGGSSRSSSSSWGGSSSRSSGWGGGGSTYHASAPTYHPYTPVAAPRQAWTPPVARYTPPTRSTPIQAPRQAAPSRPAYQAQAPTYGSSRQTPAYGRRQAPQQQRPVAQTGARPQQQPQQARGPIGAGQSRVFANGNRITMHSDGKGSTRVYNNPDGSKTTRVETFDKKGRSQVQVMGRRPDGTTTFKNSNGLSWTRSPDGLKSVSRNGRQVYSESYSNRSFGGQRVIQRNYGNHSVTFINRSYYGGNHYVFVPSYSYSPAFFGWYYHPFYSPFSYSWGYMPYSYAWWTPAPYYPSFSFWLADYFLMESMQQQHDQMIANQAAANQQQADLQQQQLSQAQQDAIRQAVDQQVQVAVQSIQQQQPMEPTKYMQVGRVFVVNDPLTASDKAGNTCTFDSGDVLKLASTPSDQNPTADLKVLTSKDTGCRAGDIVTISASDLIDMQNNLAAKVQAGMEKMKNDPNLPKQ